MGCALHGLDRFKMLQRADETGVAKRYEALFRVAQTLISIRSSEELFKLLAGELRAVVNFYVMGVGIYDEKAYEMHTTSYGEPVFPCRLHDSRRKKPSAGGSTSINSL